MIRKQPPRTERTRPTGARRQDGGASSPSRRRLLKRTTVVCGSHGRASRSYTPSSSSRPCRRSGERAPPRRRDRRGRASRPIASPGSASATSSNAVVSAADSRSASTIAASSAPWSRAEEGERDVKALDRPHDSRNRSGTLARSSESRQRSSPTDGLVREHESEEETKRRTRRVTAFEGTPGAIALRHGSVSSVCGEDAAPPSSPGRGSSRGRRGGRCAAPPPRRDRPRAGRRGRPASRRFRRPGPAIPVTETATSAVSRARAPSAIACAVSGGDRSVLLAARLAGRRARPP